MPTQQVVSPADHGCESPAAVRPLAFGSVGFFLPGLAGLESLTKRMEAAASRDVREKRAHVANNSGKCGACRYQESLMRKRHGGAYSKAGTK